MAFLAAGSACVASPAPIDPRSAQSPLHLVRVIPLPDVRGRIDHLAVDTEGGRLFVAELGNGTVDEVDLASGKVIGRITGLREPQGVAWLKSKQEIVVASGDGTVSFYRAADRQEVARLHLGDDADNVRVDPRSGSVLVGYGSGAIAVIEPSTHQFVRDIALPAHPEAFSVVGSRLYVNVPQQGAVITVDVDTGNVVSTWNTVLRGANYPMAVDLARNRIAVGYRSPASLSVVDAQSGKPVFTQHVCGDADDVFVRRETITVICGEGYLDLVAAATPDHRVTRIATAKGARTGLLVPERDRVFVAVPARDSKAELWELSFGQ